MEYKDYYAALGVPRTASQAEIKKRFRKLARQHHPDVNKGDAAAERRFKEISEAHEVVGDAEKRKAYDQLGADWETYQRAGAGGRDPFAGFRRSQTASGGPGGIRFEFHGDPADLEGFSDFFRTFFAGGAAPGSASSGPRGRTATATPPRSRGRSGSLEDILSGVGGVDLDLDGLGGRTGSGQRGTVARRPDAQATVEISLEEAFHGTQRRVEIDGRRLDVRIPRGVDTGRRIRLSGKAGSGPAAGDLYLTVHVRPHPVFTRQGADLRRELPISLGEALLGAEVPVASLKGRVLLNIPPGTQNGRMFRLKGQGMPRFGAADGDPPTGDLLVQVRVVLPTDVDEAAQEAGRRFIELVRQPDPRI